MSDKNVNWKAELNGILLRTDSYKVSHNAPCSDTFLFEDKSGTITQEQMKNFVSEVSKLK